MKLAHVPRQVKTTLINYTKTRQLLRNEIEVTPVSLPEGNIHRVDPNFAS